MPDISLPLPGCYDGEPPPPIQPVRVECLDVQDIQPEDLKAGGRTVLVTPYAAGGRVCCGQYGQFQVLTGLGGQITNALYVGKSFTKETANGSISTVDGKVIDLPGISVEVDLDDCMEGPPEGEPNGSGGGDLGVAVRDRGRWYVVKLAQGGAAAPSPDVLWAAIIGGQTLTSGQDGIKRASANLTTANLYDPNYTDRPAWAAATAYAVGDVVNRSGNSYRCTLGGTSAGGPSGTGTGIADGTCVWDWHGVSPSLPLSPDGLGIGYLWKNGAQSFVQGSSGLVPEKVMIVLDPRSAIPFALAVGEWCRLATAPVQVGNTAAKVAWPVTYI